MAQKQLPQQRFTVPKKVQHAKTAPAQKMKKKEGSLGFYLVPSLLLVGVFAALFSMSSTEGTKAAVAMNPSSTPAKPAQARTVLVDVNSSLPEYLIPSPAKNILTADAVELSMSPAAEAKYPAANAIDASLENDDQMAVCQGEGAQWTASFKGGASSVPVQAIVIYGGGTGSAKGKFCGGFELSAITEDGQTISRRFHEAGYALEGHECWNLETPSRLKSITVRSLGRADQPLVLRELLAIGQ